MFPMCYYATSPLYFLPDLLKAFESFILALRQSKPLRSKWTYLSSSPNSNRIPTLLTSWWLVFPKEDSKVSVPLPGLYLGSRISLLSWLLTWSISSPPSDLNLNITSVRLLSLSLPSPMPRISQTSLWIACYLCSNHGLCVGRKICYSHLANALEKSRTRFSM